MIPLNTLSHFNNLVADYKNALIQSYKLICRKKLEEPESRVPFPFIDDRVHCKKAKILV